MNASTASPSCPATSREARASRCWGYHLSRSWMFRRVARHRRAVLRLRHATPFVSLALGACYLSCAGVLPEPGVDEDTVKPESSTKEQDSPENDEAQSKSPGTHPSCDEAPCLKIQPDTELCQMHRNNVGPNFEGLFLNKSVLKLEPGVFHLMGGVHLRGVISNGIKTIPFGSGPSSFEVMEESGEIVAALGNATLKGENDQNFTFHLFVTPRDESDKHGLFILDSLETIDVAREAKRIRLSSVEPAAVMGNAKSSMFTACYLENEKTDSFKFDFKDGSSLELDVRSRLWSWIGGYQTGVLSAARGTFRGQEIRVSERSELAYSAKYQTDALLLPTLAVRYRSEGVASESCGVGFEPTSDSSNPYRAYLLDCNNAVTEELPLDSSSYPDRYNLLP